MKKTYEKPIAEIVDFNLKHDIMGSDSAEIGGMSGVGEGVGDYGDDAFN